MPKAMMNRSAAFHTHRFEYALTIFLRRVPSSFRCNFHGEVHLAVVRRELLPSGRLAMLFFQLLLLGGYLYSHVLSTMMAGRTQAIVHLGLLALSVVVILRGNFLFGKRRFCPEPHGNLRRRTNPCCTSWGCLRSRSACLT